MQVVFEEFELDTDAYELRRAGVAVALEPQVFEVLAHLVRHRDRLVTKEELLDEVWGDRFVSESALTSRIRAVRRALGDDGQAQRLVRTVHGRGYRFLGDVADSRAARPGSAVPPAATVSAAGTTITTAAASAGVDRVDRLPGERTPLIGRADDLAAVADLLATHRLVSLLGIGGTGKTRLAVAVARSVGASFGDGVWFVDLQAVREREAVAVAVAEAADLVLDAGPTPEQLGARLGSRDALIVLDNCEHVLDVVAGLLDHLLGHTERAAFLVTSRAPLDLPDERRYPLAPLPVSAAADAPDARPPAIELFVAAAARVGTEPTDGDVATVGAICRHLDGLPLALEIAAAQLRHLTVAELAARLDRRFDLRAVGRSSDRQSTLGAVLDDTWAMMSPRERTVIARLAAFPGSFGLDDVEGALDDLPVSDVMDAFASLADRSLVVREPAAERGHRLLETVRLYAASAAGADEMHVAVDRHARWCLRRVGGAVSAHVYDFELATWCYLHHDDLRVAEAHLLACGEPDGAARLTAATALAMHLDDGARAGEVLARVRAHLGRVVDPDLRVRLHLTGVMCGMAIRSPDTIREHGIAAVERPGGDAVADAIALVLRSWSAVLDDPAAGLELLDRAEERAATEAAARTRALARGYRGYYLALFRRWDDALASLDAFRWGLERPDYPDLVGTSARRACTFLDDPDGAASWIEEVRDFPRERFQMWANQVLAAAVHAARGDVVATARVVGRIRGRLARAGLDGLPDLLVPIAVLAHRVGDDEAASRWLAAVRSAGRPTQSFQSTVLYKRITELVDASDPDVEGEGGPDLSAVGREAFDWLDAAAAGVEA